MENSEKRKIPKRPHASMFVKGSSIGYLRKHDSLDDIAKYAPKYCEGIGLGLFKNQRKVNAYKRIKKADKVSYNTLQKTGRGPWRLIMNNKFKTVRKIDSEYSVEEWIERYKMFSNVRYRWFDDSHCWSLDKNQDRVYLKLTKKFFRFLPGITKLESLKISFRRQNHSSLLKKLNSMTRLLNSLQDLQIKSTSLSTKSFQETSLLPALIENENILKSLTSLSLGNLADEKTGEIFKALPEHCKNLIHLKFDIPKPKEWTPNLSSLSPYASVYEAIDRQYLLDRLSKEVISQIPSSSPHASYLQAVENFERLENIMIFVADPEIFVHNFRGPQSLKHVSLIFKGGSWDKISQELGSIGKEKLPKEQPIEESNQKIYQFLKKWNHLNNLISLKIECSSQPRSEAIIISNLVVLLLRSLSSLEHGEFTLASQSSALDSRKNDSTDFDDILSALQGVSSKLKSLKLISPGRCLTVSQQDEKIPIFPQLTSVSLSRNNTDLNSLQNLLNIFGKSPPIQLELPNVEICKNQNLLDLLKILSSLPKNLTISIALWIENLDLETFESTFEPWIRKPLILKGVFLEIQICENFMSECSKVFILLSKIFKGLQKEEDMKDEDTSYFFVRS